MKWRIASLFTGLLMVLAVMFGTVLTPASVEAAQVQRLIFASAGFHESNRFWTIARPDHLQFEPFWETLVGIDPKTGAYIPALATSWEISPDYKAWTFKLRQGVQFHHGYGEFTSADVPHNLALLLRKDSTATLGPFWRTVDKVETPDKYTAVFRFKRPAMPTSMFAFSRSGDLRMSSKAQWDKEGIEGLDRRPAGTGPFIYAGRKTGLNITFTRNDKHWATVPEYKELEFRIAREEATRLALLLSGDVHIGDLPRELHKDALARGLKRFSSSLATDWVSVYLGGNWHITGNKHFDPKAPFVKKKVRQALNIAINRDEMMKTIFAGRAELAYVSLWIPTSEGWNPQWESRFKELYAYNPEKAKQLLKEEGYGPGNPLKFQIWAFTEPGESEGPAIADALAIYFRNIGVQAEVQMHDWSKIRTSYRKYESKGYMWPNIIGWRPADQGVRNFYNSKGNNHHYEDDFLEKTFAAVQKSTDAKERDRLMRSIGDHLQAEYADIPLFWFRNEVFANPKVVASMVYPGPAAGRTSHFELIKLVK